MLMRSFTLLLFMLMVPAVAGAQMKVVTTTEDLGALTREIGVKHCCFTPMQMNRVLDFVS